MPTAVATGNEQGLPGLAFHPESASNGRFYVYLTISGSGDTSVQEFTRSNANAASPGSARNIISYSQPFSNHNGGWIGFDPDGMLLIASGDGGSGGDPQDNGQRIVDEKLGKLLRIDVDGDDFPGDASRNYAIPDDNPFVNKVGDDKIFAYGLRNPWRCSFDRQTDDLWIADVGQNAQEEIDVMLNPAIGSQNYGWRDREGTSGTKPPGAIDPVYRYTHGSGATQGRSVTGGYVYRGPIPGIDGHYFFADFVNNRLWSMKLAGNNETLFNGTNISDFNDWTSKVETNVAGATVNNISSFAEDEAGNLYVVGLDGEIYQLVEVKSVEITAVAESYMLIQGRYRSGDLSDLTASDLSRFVDPATKEVTARLHFIHNDGRRIRTSIRFDHRLLDNYEPGLRGLDDACLITA